MEYILSQNLLSFQSMPDDFLPTFLADLVLGRWERAEYTFDDCLRPCGTGRMLGSYSVAVRVMGKMVAVIR